MLIIFRFWKRLGGYFGPKTTSILQGKIGSLLEFTQFFEFGGSWYLEATSVNDYNFRTTLGVTHELIRERWRDTIFFPTSLAASISIVIFGLYSDPNSLLSLFILGGVLPLLLAFWIPGLWTIEDSGLKRAEWSSNGELLTIQKISAVLRDGFNKLVGFGAIFGLGTAGASVARAGLTGTSLSSTSVITGGFNNIINLNFNFLISAFLWTAALLFIVTSVSLTGNVITALSYLNSDHLSNVKKMRTTLQKRDIFLGTTQQSLDHAKIDTSVYFDSKQGIDNVLAQQRSSKRVQPMPSNAIIAERKIASDDDLTQIIIENPDEPEVSSTSSDHPPIEKKAPDDFSQPVTPPSEEIQGDSSESTEDDVSDSSENETSEQFSNYDFSSTDETDSSEETNSDESSETKTDDDSEEEK